MNILRSICGRKFRAPSREEPRPSPSGVPPARPSTSMEAIMSSNEYVEGVVCTVSDVPENQMKAFPLGNDGDKVLIVNQKGSISALAHKCPHNGAPLENGVLSDGRIRCQWHGACFNASTGDIEDFPGLDSLPCFAVKIENDNISVKAEKALLRSQRRTISRPLKTFLKDKHIVVVGGGAAGATCVFTLRSEGFDGHITFVLGGQNLPYDRTKLSKGLDVDIRSIVLKDATYYIHNHINLIRNKQVARLDTERNAVVLEDDSELRYDRLFLATGSSPRRIIAPGSKLGNIFVLRTIEDANQIFAAITEKTHLVVIGSSFIGLEAATALKKKVQSINVVAIEEVPFDRILGKDVGLLIQENFEESGVVFHMGQGVTEYVANPSNQVEGVRLNNGKVLPADVVLVAVGVSPCTDYLDNSPVLLFPNRTVEVNKFLQTSVPDIFAGGDMASAPILNCKASIGHWGLSQYHGRMAALNMIASLKKQDLTPMDTVPFFWTVLLDKSFRYTGFAPDFTETITYGSLKSLKFVVGYVMDGRVQAVLTYAQDPVAASFAELLKSGRFLTVADFGNWVHACASGSKN